MSHPAQQQLESRPGAGPAAAAITTVVVVLVAFAGCGGSAAHEGASTSPSAPAPASTSSEVEASESGKFVIVDTSWDRDETVSTTDDQGTHEGDAEVIDSAEPFEDEVQKLRDKFAEEAAKRWQNLDIAVQR